MKKYFTIIKLGGSIITDKTKPYTPNLSAIDRLVKEIKLAKKPVIIIHGQGSFAHTSAKKYGGKRGYKSLWGISKVSYDAMKMNRIVMDILIDNKLPAVSFRPNSIFFAKSGNLFAHNLESVLGAMDQGLIPVLYGDVIMDKEWKTTIFSGETSAGYLVEFLLKRKVGVSKIIQVGTTDGVYDNNGTTVKEITNNNFKEIKKSLFDSKNIDVTGGMLHKVEKALEVAKKNIPTYIINGTKKQALLSALKDKPTNYSLVK